MKNKNILTVSIGISAYNEEANIKNMLESVIMQEEKTIKIKEIIVVSDGCTDDTVNLIKQIDDKRINIIHHQKRSGKAKRINEIFRTFNSDILVLIDADLILKDRLVVEKIVSKFKNKDVALIGGNLEPLPGKTFIENTINNYIYVRNSLEEKYEIGKTAYGAHAFLAYSKTFAKHLNIPSTILNDDAYSYFVCKERGFEFDFASDAVALYRSPQSIADHINQASRHLAGGRQLAQIFGEETVRKGFKIPLKVQLLLIAKQLIKNPIAFFFLKSIHVYCQMSSQMKSFDIKWLKINTSKVLV